MANAVDEPDLEARALARTKAESHFTTPRELRGTPPNNPYSRKGRFI